MNEEVDDELEEKNKKRMQRFLIVPIQKADQVVLCI